MPYGRYSTRTRRTTRRASTGRRTGVYKRKKYAKPTAYKVATRALRLAKHNNDLARGSFQMNLLKTRAGLTFHESSPICFHLTTPVNGEKLYKFRVNAGVYGPNEDSMFQFPDVQELTGGDGNPGFAGLGQHNMWQDANNDSIQGKYKLLSQTITFELTGSNTCSCKVGIFFVKPNPKRMFRVLTNTTPGNGENFMLPDALGSFNGLLGFKNFINPMYFKQTRKPIYMRIAPGTLLSTSHIHKTITLTHNKVMNLHPVATSGTTPNAAGYQQISLLNQEWCVIVTDCAPSVPVADQPVINMRRVTRWRDLEGAAA